MAAFGAASGLPLPLSGFTFRLWMSSGGASLAVIGLTANIGLAYTLKFLWSPAFDHVRPPGFLARAGRRRGWLLAVQPALAIAAFLLALSDPIAAPLVSVGLAAVVAFLSASQDIIVDAWRIETYPLRRQGAALAAYVWGYRAALLVSGSAAIAVSKPLGWHVALLGVAALLALSPLVTWLAPEPSVRAAIAVAGGWLAKVRDALVAPLAEFRRRPGAVVIVAFVVLFKLGEALAGVMTAPFYQSLGFDRAHIAAAVGFPSMGATFAGTAIGAVAVARLGVGRALLATGTVQTAAMALYLWLAVSPGQTPVLYGVVVAEAFAEGMADAAFITYLSGLCAPAFTASQYALLSSLAAVALRTVGGLSGVLAQALGWVWFYTLCLFAAVPAMLVMLVILRRYPPAERTATP